MFGSAFRRGQACWRSSLRTQLTPRIPWRGSAGTKYDNEISPTNTHESARMGGCGNSWPLVCIRGPQFVRMIYTDFIDTLLLRFQSVPSACQAMATFRQSVVKLNWRSWDHRSFLLHAGMLAGFLALGDVAAGEDAAVPSLPAHSSEITTYCNAVISNGGTDSAATLNIEVDPDVESVIEVQGRTLAGTVVVGIRRHDEARGFLDNQPAVGSVWRWKVRGVSSVDVNFHSVGAFRFDLVSIKAYPAEHSGEALPLSQVSRLPRSAP